MTTTSLQHSNKAHNSTVVAVSKSSRSPIYRDGQLLQVSMPVGGIGAGSVCIAGNGAMQNFSLRQKPKTTALPDQHGYTDAVFALIHIKGAKSATRLVEGPVPVEKLYDQGLQALGYRKGGQEGFPRFRECEFQGEYPFGCVRLSDKHMPVTATLTAWNPFIPGDDRNSSIPVAILEYEIENISSDTIEAELSLHASNLALGKRSNVIANGFVFGNSHALTDELFGTAAIVALAHTAKIKGACFRGGWFDAMSMLWKEASTGTFCENAGIDDAEQHTRLGASLLVPISLKPGERVTVPFAVAWHFPNSNQLIGLDESACGPDCACDTPGSDALIEIGSKWRPYYAGQWKNAVAVAEYVRAEYETLRSRTLAFKEALYSTTIPKIALDAVASNLAILKSPTVLRQENGNIWAWEGCQPDQGCCHGSCTHVWNYAQAMPHLFPALERTLREQELQRSMNEIGHVSFRSALPDGPAPHDYHPAADGQLGGL